MKRQMTALLAAAVWLALAGSSSAGLPVKKPGLEKREAGIRNLVTWERLHNVKQGSCGEGMMIDLGSKVLNGTIYSGQYPFEFGDEPGTSLFPYPRYEKSEELREGVGIVHLKDFLKPGTDKDANDWVSEENGDGQCSRPDDCPARTMAYRIEIDIPADLDPRFDPEGESDIYDGRQSFSCGKDCRHPPWKPIPTIILGPMASNITSSHPGRMLIALETDEPCLCSVEVSRAGTFEESGFSKNHEIEVSSLQPGKKHHYQVFCRNKDGEKVRSGRYHFRAAPRKDSTGSFSFAFASDSREGAVGEEAVMGHNRKTLSRIAAEAYRLGADFFIFGGDLINGYTTDAADFRMQLKAWKQSMEGFWRFGSVFPVMGNHETLVNNYDDGSYFGLSLDKWPYETRSAEAVFAQEFYNPENGPTPADKRRPPYRENVYAFQYGPALFIAFNNNYWWSSNPEEYGECPQGCILGDQLEWIEKKLEQAENDSLVKYIFLYAQEAVFPSGGHPEDGMWWNGSNNVKAYKKNAQGDIVPAGSGIVEVRNRFWKAVARSSKTAAVLTGDEHNYQRKLITAETPVGLPSDDMDGDGGLDRYSPNPEFVHPTYELTAGHAGAPFHGQEDVPWKDAVQVFSSRIGFLFFRVTPGGVSMTSYANRGERIIDHVDNLMTVKNISVRPNF